MTYSLSITGMNANHQSTVANLTLSDTNALPGGQQLAMAQGAYFLCKRPDGSQAYYRLDAERSTPALPVLIRV